MIECQADWVLGAWAHDVQTHLLLPPMLAASQCCPRLTSLVSLDCTSRWSMTTLLCMQAASRKSSTSLCLQRPGDRQHEPCLTRQTAAMAAAAALQSICIRWQDPVQSRHAVRRSEQQYGEQPGPTAGNPAGKGATCSCCAAAKHSVSSCMNATSRACLAACDLQPIEGSLSLCDVCGRYLTSLEGLRPPLHAEHQIGLEVSCSPQFLLCCFVDDCS